MRSEEHRWRVALAAAAWLSAGVPSLAATGRVQHGEVIYQTGLRADGSVVQANRLDVGRVHPASAACMNCHRPSGMGQREGKLLVPAIAGHMLFAPLHRPTLVRAHPSLKRQPLRAFDRAAYTSTTLATTLRSGIDVGGRPLDVAMPRYSLSNQDAADIEAYLRDLSARPLPGATGGAFHLATVVTPDASPQVRRTIEAAVGAWARALDLGQWHVKWSLWTLSGPPDTWAAQLDRRWKAQPVFAMVSGAGGTNWTPVANFCEANHIPCVFPSLESLPSNAEKAHFNFYLSAAVQAEAALLSQWQGHTATGPRTLVQIVAPGDAAAAVGARALEQSIHQGATSSVTNLPGADAGALSSALASLRAGDAVVVWARDPAVAAMLRTVPPKPGVSVWLSATMAPEHRVNVPAAWRPQLSWASMHSHAIRRNAGGTLGVAPWARGLGLPANLDPVALGDAYAATFYFSDALARMREGLNAEYFNERLEDAVDLRPASAAFFRMSLGPNQRVAVRGGHILGYGVASQMLTPQSPFLRADVPSPAR
jgi:hypothetical protein